MLKNLKSLIFIVKGGDFIDSSLSYFSDEGRLVLNILNCGKTNNYYKDIFKYSFDEEVSQMNTFLEEYIEKESIYLKYPLLNNYSELVELKNPYVELIIGLELYLNGLKLLQEENLEEDLSSFRQRFKDLPIFRLTKKEYLDSFKSFKNVYLEELKEKITDEKYNEIISLIFYTIFK